MGGLFLMNEVPLYGESGMDGDEDEMGEGEKFNRYHPNLDPTH